MRERHSAACESRKYANICMNSMNFNCNVKISHVIICFFFNGNTGLRDLDVWELWIIFYVISFTECKPERRSCPSRQIVEKQMRRNCQKKNDDFRYIYKGEQIIPFIPVDNSLHCSYYSSSANYIFVCQRAISRRDTSVKSYELLKCRHTYAIRAPLYKSKVNHCNFVIVIRLQICVCVWN